MTIGKRIRELRQERGLSQEALGARSGISTFSVSRIETGRSVPGSDTVEKVAHALGVEPGELFQASAEMAGAGKAEAPSKGKKFSPSEGETGRTDWRDLTQDVEHLHQLVVMLLFEVAQGSVTPEETREVVEGALLRLHAAVSSSGNWSEESEEEYERRLEALMEKLGPVLRRAPQDERQDEPDALSRETVEKQIREGITVAMVEANGAEFPPLSAEDVEKAGIGPCLRILIDTLGIGPGYGVVIRRENPR
jgi:transcriptional regulator with XRE-family HTH domain